MVLGVSGPYSVTSCCAVRETKLLMIEAVIQDTAEGEIVGARWLPADLYMQFMFSLAVPSWMFSVKHVFLEKPAQRHLSYTADSSRVWRGPSSASVLLCPFL